MSNLDYQFFYRRNLPHYQPRGATFFITFRLAGSLPKVIVERLVDEAREIEKRLAQIVDPHERSRQADLEQHRLFGKWDAALAASCTGPQWLKDERLATLLYHSLQCRAGEVYELDAFCIMSNHAHLVCQPTLQTDGEYHSLSRIMHSLKIHTALEGNGLLNR